MLAPNLPIQNRRPPWANRSRCSRDLVETRPRKRAGQIAHKGCPLETCCLLPPGPRRLWRRAPPRAGFAIASSQFVIWTDNVNATKARCEEPGLPSQQVESIRHELSPTVEAIILRLRHSGEVKSVGAVLALELIGPFLGQVIVVFLDHRKASIVKIVWRFQSRNAG